MRGALVMLAAATVAILGGGLFLAATWHLSYGHGLYCAVGTASTVGCDANPESAAGRWVAAAVILTAVPLLAAAFGRLTSLHVRKHVGVMLDEHHRLIRRHVDRALAQGQTGAEEKE